MNRRKHAPVAADPTREGGEGPAATPVPPAAPATPIGPTAPPLPPPPAGDEPRKRGLARHLPRAGLILFLLAILIVFHGVLLPFVLAVFFAYLIYPVVRRLERIPIGRRRPPRWLAVISVYALLFVVGWWTIPPLVANFWDQLRKLGHDVPTLFEKLQVQRKKFDTWVADVLEVQSLSESTRVALFADVDALAEGRLERFEPPEGLDLPPPPPVEPEPSTDVAPRETVPPAIVQIFGINVNVGPRPAAGGGAPPPGAGDARGPPSRPEEGGAGGAAPAGAPDAEPGEDVPAAAGSDDDAAELAPAPEPEPGTEADAAPARERRFDESKGDALKYELRDAINAELEKPGPARGVPAKVEREIVPAILAKEVELPADDPDALVFARNCGARVAAATQREDYAKVFNAYFESAVNSARSWVQRELTQVAGLAGGVVAGLVRGIFDFFMVLMLTAFFLVFFPRIRDYVRDLVAPPYREDYAQVLKRIDTRLSGAIRGQVIICIVNAVLTFPGLWFIGAHTDATNLAAYAVLLSVIAGILSMIPIFGVILSTVPMVVLALAQGSLWGAVLVIGWICVIHAIEAYLLNPNILGHSASMNPIIVVFALLAGKQIYGLVGALLAVPVASVLVSLFGYYRRLVTESGEGGSGTGQSDTWGD